MKNIYLVRHGQTDQNKKKLIQGRCNYPLNDEGRKQAKKVSDYFIKNNININIILSSPLDRAYETAKIISKNINYQKEVIKDFAFIERDFGVAEGLEVNDKNFIKVLDDSYIGLEKSFEIKERVYQGLMKHKSDGDNILIVSHAHTIKAILAKLDERIKFDTPLVNCAISHLVYHDNKLEIIEFNIEP